MIINIDMNIIILAIILALMELMLMKVVIFAMNLNLQII